MDHAPTYAQVPPADSIGRHLCEVACSCGLFRTTATSARAEAALAAAARAFEVHRERASHAGVVVPPRRTPAPAESAPPQPSRRRSAYVAAVAVVAVLGVVGAVVLLGRDDPQYAGAPTLVGGPDRTGPAVLDPGDSQPVSDDDPLTRQDAYAELRAAAPEFVAWTELEIDSAGERVCGLLAAGRSVAAIDPALVAFAEDVVC